MNPEQQGQVYSQMMPQYYQPQEYQSPLNQPVAPQAVMYHPEMQQQPQPIYNQQQPQPVMIYNPVQQQQPGIVYQQPGISSSTTTTQVVQNPVQQQTFVISQQGQLAGGCDCGNPHSVCCCAPSCPCCDDVNLLSEGLYIIIMVLSLLHPLVFWISFPIIFCRTRALARRCPTATRELLQQYKTFSVCGWVAYGISLTGYLFPLAWPFMIVSLVYGRLVYLALQGYTGQIVIVNQAPGAGATTIVVQH